MRQRVRAAGQSLAGDGMLLRLRNASIALVAAVAAVGLGLTLFIAQLGFPTVFSSPIPGNPTEAGSVHAAVALTHSPAVATSTPALSVRSRAGAQGRPRHAGQTTANGGGNSGDRGVGGSRHVAVSPGSPQAPAGQQPVASVPASTPTTPVTAPTASAPSAAPTPAVVESPSKSGADGQAKGSSPGTTKPNGPSTAKVTSDGSAKSKDGQSVKSDSQTPSVGKLSNAAAEKAGKDQSAAATTKPVAPPPPAATPAPETVSPAAAKEAADSGESDRSRH
ncbi:MAG TPA: hypothetical protein VN758_08800 [Solirubrobacterales bacterium]|nr:hypothetical protein [Solirubrobacterales bacterium]